MVLTKRLICGSRVKCGACSADKWDLTPHLSKDPTFPHVDIPCFLIWGDLRNEGKLCPFLRSISVLQMETCYLLDRKDVCSSARSVYVPCLEAYSSGERGSSLSEKKLCLDGQTSMTLSNG